MPPDRQPSSGAFGRSAPSKAVREVIHLDRVPRRCLYDFHLGSSAARAVGPRRLPLVAACAKSRATATEKARSDAQLARNSLRRETTPTLRSAFLGRSINGRCGRLPVSQSALGRSSPCPVVIGQNKRSGRALTLRKPPLGGRPIDLRTAQEPLHRRLGNMLSYRQASHGVPP